MPKTHGITASTFLGSALELLNAARMKAVFRPATERNALQFYRGAISAQQL